MSNTNSQAIVDDTDTSRKHKSTTHERLEKLEKRVEILNKFELDHEDKCSSLDERIKTTSKQINNLNEQIKDFNEQLKNLHGDTLNNLDTNKQVEANQDTIQLYMNNINSRIEDIYNKINTNIEQFTLERDNNKDYYNTVNQNIKDIEHNYTQIDKQITTLQDSQHSNNDEFIKNMETNIEELRLLTKSNDGVLRRRIESLETIIKSNHSLYQKMLKGFKKDIVKLLQPDESMDSPQVGLAVTQQAIIKLAHDVNELREKFNHQN
uniref:Uncharacterized protein n=1 Tax=Megaviridae environmental sample TaxID=1737588 RepID=A0A5J6VK06_9VIRU|nr:MAG: hypothetical protein [Megaviridae environmental sample]